MAIDDRLLGGVYDRISKPGWPWDSLTGGEKAEFRRQAEPIIQAALAELGLSGHV